MPLTDRDEKIIRAIPSTPQPRNPRCPACDHDPLEFACNLITTGMGHVVAVIWCGNCGHTLNAQFAGMANNPGPRIVKPA